MHSVTARTEFVQINDDSPTSRRAFRHSVIWIVASLLTASTLAAVGFVAFLFWMLEALD